MQGGYGWGGQQQPQGQGIYQQNMIPNQPPPPYPGANGSISGAPGQFYNRPGGSTVQMGNSFYNPAAVAGGGSFAVPSVLQMNPQLSGYQMPGANQPRPSGMAPGLAIVAGPGNVAPSFGQAGYPNGNNMNANQAMQKSPVSPSPVTPNINPSPQPMNPQSPNGAGFGPRPSYSGNMGMPGAMGQMPRSVSSPQNGAPRPSQSPMPMQQVNPNPIQNHPLPVPQGPPPANANAGYFQAPGGRARSGTTDWKKDDALMDCVIQYNELQLGRVLGEGSFGIVYAGEFRSTPVAIKQLKVNTLTPKQIEEFMAEVKALKDARHPNIVLLMGVSFSPYSIVTELLDTSLFQILHVEKKQLTDQQQLHVALCVARAVASLHQQRPPVMHRDLKSLNVLCSKDLSQVKICDLGLIKMKAQAKVMANKNESKGTPIWCSPEVLADMPYDEKCDVYSFSFVIFEIVTGTVPFAPEIPSQADLYKRVALQGERPRIPNTVRGRWSRLMQQCWATDPRLRPTMAEVVKTLQTLFSN